MSSFDSMVFEDVSHGDGRSLRMKARTNRVRPARSSGLAAVRGSSRVKDDLRSLCRPSLFRQP